MRSGWFFIFCLVFPVLTIGDIAAAGEQNKCFETSLHHTGEGMRYWYESENGFMSITNTPYSELGCKNCHIQGCNECHLEETGEGLVYSTGKARKSKTCLKCHSREKATIEYDEMMDCPGVHANAFMGCMDCHTKREVHGDGTFYHSIRESGAMDAACEDCHTRNSEDYPPTPDTKSHTVHKNRLDCNACHVQNTISCYNCHFGVLAETKSKPNSFVQKVKDFLLLVKYRGKVTSGTMQTLVGKNNEPFVVYVPYFTHSIMEQGRKCEDCHDTRAGNILASASRFSPVSFKDGKLDFYNGVIPLVPDRLDWLFLEKKEGEWTPFQPDSPPLIQLGLYAEPFTMEELKKMAEPQKYME